MTSYQRRKKEIDALNKELLRVKIQLEELVLRPESMESLEIRIAIKTASDIYNALMYGQFNDIVVTDGFGANAVDIKSSGLFDNVI